MQPPPVQVAAADPASLKHTIGSYSYSVTAADLQMEQEAFEAGEGVCTKNTS